MSKVAVVTGCTEGIGRSIAHKLAEEKYQVVLAARNPDKCKRVAQEISASTGNTNIFCETVDVSLYESIQAFASQFDKKYPVIHILVNNAAVVPNIRQTTSEGLELQFATNVMGYYWMIQALEGPLSKGAKEGDPARIVNIASNYAGNLDTNDLQFTNRKYEPNIAYKQSKQANRMLTVAFAEQFKSNNIIVNSCHPGLVSTTVAAGLGFGGSQSAEEAARTPVWLATEAPVASGKYYDNLKVKKCGFSRKKEDIAKLMQVCEQVTQSVKPKCNL